MGRLGSINDKYMSQLYNLYCDESCHLENDRQKSMVLGALWCPRDKAAEVFKRIREIKQMHGLSQKMEIKWTKVSPSGLAFYKHIVDYFFDDDDLHFRCLVVPDKNVLDHSAYKQTHDDWYYKMYFDLIKTIINPDDTYNIFLDIKDTQGSLKVDKLHEVLSNNHYDFNRSIIKKIQLVRSHEIELQQVADLLIGALSYLHRGLEESSAKRELISRIKARSGYTLMQSTMYKEDKFNVFVWDGRRGNQTIC